MQQSEREFLAVKCRVALERVGIQIKLVTDFREAQRLMEKLDKTIGPALDAHSLLLTERNSLFVFALNGGEPVLGLGLRLDDWGTEDADSFLKRSIEVIFGVRIKRTRFDIFSKKRWGRAVYVGELKSISNNGISPIHAKILRLTFAYAHFRAFTDLQADTTYCFLRRGDARKAVAYGFLSNAPFVWDTDRTMYPDGNPEWVMHLRAGQLPCLLASVSPIISEWLAIDEQDIFTVSGNAKTGPNQLNVNA